VPAVVLRDESKEVSSLAENIAKVKVRKEYVNCP
jgi:hypothetical protein